jgi:sortase A
MPRILLIPLSILVGLGAWVGALSLGWSADSHSLALSPGDGALPAHAPAGRAPTQAPILAHWPVPPPSPRPKQAERHRAVQMIIPRLGLRAPVVDEGVDRDGRLPIAPGQVITHFLFSAGAGLPGNYVAYGHDDIAGSLFRYLPNMRVGDLIELRSGGALYAYRVTGSRVVQPSDVSVLAPTRTPTLTLISCTPYMVDTQRIVVTAALARQATPAG